MVVKTPEVILMARTDGRPHGAHPLKTTPTFEEMATLAAPALLRLAEDMLPSGNVYGPLIKALIETLRAYVTQREDVDAQRNVATVKKLWEQYVQLAPDDKRANIVRIKLDRAIAKL